MMTLSTFDGLPAKHEGGNGRAFRKNLALALPS